MFQTQDPMSEEISTLSHDARFPEALPTAVRWSHALLAPRLRPGDVVVDATAGNGHDTLFLAQRVLPGGRVFAFDVQAAALESTRARIADSGPGAAALEAVTLVRAGHQELERHLPRDCQGRIRAFMFNLGWLPGSDKTCITRAETTLAALDAAIAWLAEGGLITIVCYPGHEGGDVESRDVERWAGRLPPDRFEAQSLAFLNLDGAPPRCIVVRRRTRLKASPFG